MGIVGLFVCSSDQHQHSSLRAYSVHTHRRVAAGIGGHPAPVGGGKKFLADLRLRILELCVALKRQRVLIGRSAECPERLSVARYKTRATVPWSRALVEIVVPRTKCCTSSGALPEASKASSTPASGSATAVGRLEVTMRPCSSNATRLVLVPSGQSQSAA